MSRLLFQGVEGLEDCSKAIEAELKCRCFGSTSSDDDASLRKTNHESDKLHEECGVVAIHGHADAARMAYLGLYALQHRGQESAGIATADGQHLANIKGMGLVSKSLPMKCCRSCRAGWRSVIRAIPRPAIPPS